MLLDPLKEQFDLPAVLVKLGNHRRRQCRVVGQKYQRLARWILESHPTQMLRVVFDDLDNKPCVTTLMMSQALKMATACIRIWTVSSPLYLMKNCVIFATNVSPGVVAKIRRIRSSSVC